MVFRLVVFDVDGTLVEGNEPAQAEVAERLKRLERRGVMLALASGKPLSYLLGFARGIGIKISFVIAENGCVIFDTAKREERRL
ncbi:MAG: HAD-IIB family hydrolase, partial [Candidatus Bathyarchaeota archaeon]|nr:HAD-IIB family hydrolase [Candidatus Bathyarchaeota archaeon]